MRRLLAVTVAAGFVAAALAAWSVAAPAPSATEPKVSADTAAPAANTVRRRRLPPLPAEVRRRGRWLIGVKCDFPPFGYIEAETRRNEGYDVDVGRWFARFAFGNARRVRFECVTTPSRIPTLQARRVDIIISTLTYTRERDETIDYSIPYYTATGRLLVGTNTRVAGLRAGLAGKTVVTTSGSVYDRWLTNCFGQTTKQVFPGTAAAVLAVKDGRAQAFMFDDALLLDIAMRDPELRLTTHRFLSIPWGIGIRQGDRAMKRWVDSRLRILQRSDRFLRILREHAAPAVYRAFRNNVPRPRRSFRYPTGDPAAVCPR